MTGIALLLAAGMVVVIVIWSIVNDRVGPGERTTGLLAMRDVKSPSERADSPVGGGPASGTARRKTGPLA